MASALAEQTYRDVMTVEPPIPWSPLEQVTLDFLFGEVWPRPGLSRRDRRWVTLACVAAADSPRAIEDHIYAALNSGAAKRSSATSTSSTHRRGTRPTTTQAS